MKQKITLRKHFNESKEKKSHVENTLGNKEETLTLLQNEYTTQKSLKTKFEINKTLLEISELEKRKGMI